VSAWGVVISTDTAFLLGVLALLGPACPPRREEVEYAAQRTRAYPHFSDCFSKQLSWKLVKVADT
jgi:hypothetical protein